jgi:hypothetical protein
VSLRERSLRCTSWATTTEPLLTAAGASGPAKAPSTGSVDGCCAAVAFVSVFHSPPVDGQSRVQDDRQDAPAVNEAEHRGLPTQTGSNMDNQQVLAAPNNAFAYRDSQDSPEEQSQDHVLFLPYDETEIIRPSKTPASALSTATEDSAVLNLSALNLP